MSSDPQERVKEIISLALRMPPDQRIAFIDRIADEPEVLAEAKSLVLADTAPSMTEMLKVPTSVGPGSVIEGRYRIERRLGSGGCGDAWLAVDQTLHARMVVIKVLKEKTDPWFEKAFETELKALARIYHPGIVQPIGAGRLAGGPPYIIMQFVAGRTLREVMANGPMPLPRIADLVRKIGNAVEAAHAENVYHCDLKPENIMIQALPDGAEEPRLIDFGVARILQSSAEPGTTVHIAGTPVYMAPEQLEGHFGPASDTYAVAMICYEMLTGQVPFSRDSLPFGRSGPVNPPSRLRHDLSTEIDEIILLALDRNPAARPQKTADFTTRAAAFVTAAAAKSDAGRRRVKPGLLTAIAIALILISGSVIYVVHYETRPPGPAQATMPPPSVDPQRMIGIAIRKESGPMPDSPAVVGNAYAVHAGFRIEFTPQEPGHLYLFSEDAELREAMSVLFPSPTANEGSSYIAAGRHVSVPQNTWFTLDTSARQRLWLVWSRQPLDKFERASRWANPADKGEMRDPAERSSLRSVLGLRGNAQILLSEGEVHASRELDPLIVPVDFVGR